MLRTMHESLLNNGGAPPPGPLAAGPNDEAAQALYPDPTPPPKATAPTHEIAALRAADPARAFYSDTSSIGPRVIEEMTIAANPMGTAEAREKQGVEFASAAVDIGLTAADVSQLAAFARGFKAKPPTEDERAAYQRTAVKEMRERYGGEFDQVFADARQLAQRDPRMAVYLTNSALGDHPWLIGRMAELGRAARARGQLK